MKIKNKLHVFVLAFLMIFQACDENEDATNPSVNASFVLTTTEIPYGASFEAVNTSTLEGGTYEWNFGDGMGIFVDNTKKSMSYRYQFPGYYTIRLTVKDADGNVQGVYTEEVQVYSYVVTKYELLDVPATKNIVDPNDSTQTISSSWDEVEGVEGNPDVIMAMFNSQTGQYVGISEYFENLDVSTLPVEANVGTSLLTSVDYVFLCLDEDVDTEGNYTYEAVFNANVTNPLTSLVAENGVYKVTIDSYVNIYFDRINSVEDLQ